MRIASWASLALLPLAAACAGGGAERSGAGDSTAAAGATTASATSPVPPTVSAHTEGGRTRLDILTSAGARHTLTVTRDSTVAPTTDPTRTEVVGTLGDSVLVLIDDYPSIPGGMSFCQAGEERFLRVIALSGSGARERYQAKLASCRTELELADPGLTWRPDSSLLRIDWLAGPTGGGETRTLRIGGDGRVTSDE
jgi:hypothetical protein